MSTSPLEGTNNKIGILQRRAYGDRHYGHFKLRLFALYHTTCSRPAPPFSTVVNR
ncbi:MAG: transposase [Planctomycetes bacterium]|nr:transposase [Planctomycetota bacterium]